MQKTVSVIIPAFNEAQNLPALLAQVHEAFDALNNCLYECIVVNDASTDDTDRTLRELASTYPRFATCA